MENNVTSTEFQNRAGQYLEASGKRPVFITRHNRPVRVLIDIEEYERLKSYDTRRIIYPEDIDPAELEAGFQGPDTPELNKLLD